MDKTTAQIAAGIRRRVLEHTLKNNGGYLSQACSSAETLAVLYKEIMHLGSTGAPIMPRAFPGVPSPFNPDYFTGGEFNGPHTSEYDRFIFSPAHYALAVYACLIETGRMDEKGLEHFNVDGFSVEMIGAEHSPGMEVTNGSLGQALSQAAGIAYARKLKKEAGKVWVYMSDGEFQIGQTWEAFQFMAHHKLDNMGVFVDVNCHQCEGRMVDVMNIEPLDARLNAFGAEALKVYGHDIKGLLQAAATPHIGKPLVVLCATNPFEGIPLLKQNAPKYHYVRIKNEQEKNLYRLELERMSPRTLNIPGIIRPAGN
ncbi:MAG: 1-deoxy-D-xylulose-5-phosphate synthase N-terminal domain-containing protein [bacterium]